MRLPTEWGIDCDVLVYSVGFAVQSNKDERGNKVDPYTTTSLKQATDQMLNAIYRTMDAVSARTGHTYLTGEGNYRVGASLEEHPYKGHRSSAKPIRYDQLRTFLIEECGAIVAEGCEADDLLARGAYEHGHGIATIDKDLSMVAGWHYNWNKDKLFMVSPEEGIRFFYRQMLTGDTADNIPGLFRMTGVKAMPKIMEPLTDFESEVDMYNYVRDVYLMGYDKVGMCLDEREAVVDGWLKSIGTQLWMDIKGERTWHPPEG